MDLKPFISLSCRFLCLALVPILALAAVATASADPQRITYTKKFVRIVGSNIPVPVWVAEGPLPKTTYPVRSYDYNEISKIPGAYTPAQVLANDPSITISGRH
jgi:hypothetical protein